MDVPAEWLGREGECPYCHEKLTFPGGKVEPSREEGRALGSWRLYEQAGSFALSIVLHVAVILWIVWLVAGPVLPGMGGGFDVGIAEYPGESLTDGGAEGLREVEAVPAADEQLQVVEVAPPRDLIEIGIEVEVAAISAQALSGAGDASAGPIQAGAGGDGSGPGKARFMGVEGKGTRFCIIADRSGSMAEANKLDYVKREILATLGALKPGSRFFVVFYNHEAETAPGRRWLSGKPGLQAIAPWTQSLVGEGGTDPLPAFREAFALSPRPDTIFFLSDGLFEPNVPDEVARLNVGRPKSIIHAISFVDRSSESLMRRIAEQSGGKYRHVDAPAPANP